MSLQLSDSITLRINRHSEITCFLDTLFFFFFGSYSRFQEAGRGLWGGWNWLGAAWLSYFLRSGARVGHSPLQGSHLLGWGLAKAGLLVQLPGCG